MKITIRLAQWQCLLPEQELLHHFHFQPDQDTFLCSHTVLCLFYSCITFVLGFIHEEGDTIYCLKVKVWYGLHLTPIIVIKTFTLKAQWPVRAIGSIFMPRILGLAFRLPGTAWFHTLDDISNLVVSSFVILLPTEAPSHQTCHSLLGFDITPTKWKESSNQ